MKLKTVLTWAAISFAAWWVIQQPAGAAHLIHNIGVVIGGAAAGLSHFVTTI